MHYKSFENGLYDVAVICCTVQADFHIFNFQTLSKK